LDYKFSIKGYKTNKSSKRMMELMNMELNLEKIVVDDLLFELIEKMEENENESSTSHSRTSKVYHDCITAQLDKKQDFSQTGKGKDNFGDEAEFDYIIVMDGHGEPRYFDKHFGSFVYAMDFPTLLATENPVMSIVNAIQENERALMLKCGINSFLQVGSTLSIAKIYRNSSTRQIKVVCYNVGDSIIAIYKNKSLVYRNEPHTIMHAREHDRLISRILDGSASITDGVSFRLLDNNSICQCVNDRVIFKYGDFLNANLVPTQCLGHLGVTGIEPEIYIAEFDEEDFIRVMVYSDGVDDMICDDLLEDSEFMASANCAEIIEKSKNRWNSKWTVLPDVTDTPGVKPYVTSFGRGDDCSIGIWDNYYYDCFL
jgi:serine/threonine protein phosphatase PrpC